MNSTEGPLNWRLEGPFDSSYSLALVNRETARGLASVGVSVALHSTEGLGDFEPNATFLSAHADLQEMHALSRQMPPERFDVTSRNLYPPRVTGMEGNSRILNPYAWEESCFPREWVEQFNQHLDAVGCLSTHVFKVLQDNGVCVNLGVSGCGVDHWDRVATPSQVYPLDARPFRFIHVSSCFPRKGADAMLQAYGQAFTSRDPVSLVIKTFPNPHNTIGEQLQALRASNLDYPHVVLIEQDLSDGELKSLYQQCHVLVAPSRAEGFGLPIAEALLSGLPVIATAWSGQLDFCDERCAWLVDYRFAQADTHFGLLPSTWADPLHESLVSAMRSAWLAPPEQRRSMAAHGRQLLERRFRWTDVARRSVALTRQKAKTAQPRVGWISTWNVKCGIATYSEHLIRHMPVKPTVLAAIDSKTLGPDDDDCVRCWYASDDDKLESLSQQIEQRQLDTLVIQFNYGFFGFAHLARFIESHKARGRTIYLTPHSTTTPPHRPDKQLADIVPALRKVDRIFAHSISDLNRLKELGLVDNVCLFPHGILAPSSASAEPPSELPTIATYGFCLPHKGLIEVIDAVALLKGQGQTVRLRMVNALYPAEISHKLAQEIRARIALHDLADQVEFSGDFLSDAESLRLLSQADLVLFVYHPTTESASGAVRFGLSSTKPVMVTDLDIFNDVRPAVWTVRDNTPTVLARRLAEVLHQVRQPSDAELERQRRAANWREQHLYANLGQRLWNILLSVHRNGSVGRYDTSTPN